MKLEDLTEDDRIALSELAALDCPEQSTEQVKLRPVEAIVGVEFVIGVEHLAAIQKLIRCAQAGLK